MSDEMKKNIEIVIAPVRQYELALQFAYPDSIPDSIQFAYPNLKKRKVFLKKNKKKKK